MSLVLVADDSAANRKLALMVLGRAGHELLEAADGEVALRMAREAMPQLIVMDIQMPRLDGLSVARLLRADPATAGIKVLALTALAMQGDEQRIVRSGIDGYLTKPYHYPALIALVAKLLR